MCFFCVFWRFLDFGVLFFVLGRWVVLCECDKGLYLVFYRETCFGG